MALTFSFMKRFAPWMSLILWPAAVAWPHGAPVPVNTIHLTAHADQLTIRFHSAASWWVFTLLNEFSPPPRIWPAETQRIIKTYFDQHFILNVDGKNLPSTLTYTRYSEEVWRYYLGSQLDLELTYVLPPNAKILSGTVLFYKESKESLMKQPDLDEPTPHFETNITVLGKSPRILHLTLENGTFSCPVADILSTPAQRWNARWNAGLMAWLSMPWLVLIFAAFHLQLKTRLQGAAQRIVLAATAAGVSGITAWRQASSEQGAYALGLFVVLALLAFLIEGLLAVYYRRLRRASESQAPALFISQVRFVSLLIGGIALFLVADSWARPSL
jgi:hypothetical protein